MTELLKCLTQWFPKGNTLPHKYSTMKQMMRNLGTKAKCIHACENNYMLYWKEYAYVTWCLNVRRPNLKLKRTQSLGRLEETQKNQEKF